MTAPYQIQDLADGLFTLTASADPAAPAPTAEEALLAWWLQSIVAGLRAALRAGQFVLPVPPLLLAAAREGLCAEPRATVDQLQAMANAFGPSPQPLIQPGAYVVTLDESAAAFDTAIRRDPTGPPPTEDQYRFLDKLLAADRLIRLLYAPDRGARLLAARNEALSRIVQAGRVGLQEQPPTLRLAEVAVQQLVADAMRERGPAARLAYLRSLGTAYALTLLCVALGALAMAVAGRLAGQGLFTMPEPLRLAEGPLLLLTVALGAFFVGAWLSATARLESNSREVVESLYDATFPATIRALFLLGFGLFALLLLHKQVVVFAFGGATEGGPAAFSTAMVLTKLSAAVLTGGFLGLSEAALPRAVTQRAGGLVSALGPAAPPP